MQVNAWIETDRKRGNMVQMTITESGLRDAVERAHQGDRVILFRDGEPFCAVVPIADAEWMDQEEEADLHSVQEALKESGTVSWMEAKRDLGLD